MSSCCSGCQEDMLLMCVMLQSHFQPTCRVTKMAFVSDRDGVNVTNKIMSTFLRNIFMAGNCGYENIKLYNDIFNIIYSQPIIAINS